MPVNHFSQRHFIRLVSTQSRRADLNPWELSRTHVALGRFLAAELVDKLPIEPCDIAHPQGVRQGWKLANEGDSVLLCLMRSGLYVTEGVREVLPNAPVFHVVPNRNEGLSEADFSSMPAAAGRTFILIDAVVNTGASIEPVLKQLILCGAKIVAVLSLVSPVPTAERLAAEYPEVHFFFARISNNQYVGNGASDTGNRLLGTFPSANGGDQ